MTVAVTDVVLEWGTGRLQFASDPAPETWARFVLTDLAGWYGGVGVRGETMDRLGHGTIGGRKWRTRRALTLKAHVEVADAEDRDRVMRELSGVLWDGLEGTLTATVDEVTLSCPVKIDGEPGIVPSGVASVTVQVPLTSDDPWLFGEWRTSTLRPVGAGVGLEYPLLVGDLGAGPVITFGSAIETDVLVWNDGNATSWPVFTVHADAPGGFLLGLGDRIVEYPRPTWSDSPVIVDMTGEVLVSGYDQSQLLAARDWSSIAPGTFERPRFELLQGGTGWCEVSHRDTYI